MLEEAVAGNIPLVSVRSNDLLHIEFVLRQTFPTHQLCSLVNGIGTTATSPLYYHISKEGSKFTHDLLDLYKDAEENEYTVILINFLDAQPVAMDCGELLPDSDTIHAMICKMMDKEDAEEATQYLTGLSVQDIKKCLSLATVFYDTLSVYSLRKTKEKLFMNVVGLERVNRKTPFFFMEDTYTHKWVAQNKPYMFADIDHRLVPKGLLLHGEPGTGKTELSKYIAREWGVPLFRLDINSMLTKWQGEAEHHLSGALDTLDRESPCIVLFDEVEKLFLSNSESDTSQRMLSKLLWWLQYRESKCFAFMTCNNMDAIPPELYREGRINKVWESKGLKPVQVNDFVVGLLKTFKVGDGVLDRCLKNISNVMNNPKKQGITSQYQDLKHIPQATVSQWVVEYLQSHQFGL